MSDEATRLREELAALGARLDAKLAELRQQGLLHGPEREAAADLQIRQAHLLGRAGTVSGEIATDVAILKHAFERWLARTDKASENHERK